VLASVKVDDEKDLIIFCISKFFFFGVDIPLLFFSDLKMVAHTSTFSYCYGSAMDDVGPMSIVYKFILDTSKCKVMPKHKSDFLFPEFSY